MKPIEETHPTYCKYIKEELLYPNKLCTSDELNKALQETTIDKAVLRELLLSKRIVSKNSQHKGWDIYNDAGEVAQDTVINNLLEELGLETMNELRKNKQYRKF